VQLVRRDRNVFSESTDHHFVLVLALLLEFPSPRTRTRKKDEEG